jgi:hypothetical protein
MVLGVYTPIENAGNKSALNEFLEQVGRERQSLNRNFPRVRSVRERKYRHIHTGT